MSFNLNEEVMVIGVDHLKKIIDMETINNRKIYYMSDNTSYEESQLFHYPKSYEELNRMLGVEEKPGSYILLGVDCYTGYKRLYALRDKYREEERQKKLSSKKRPKFGYIGDFFFWLTMKSK